MKISAFSKWPLSPLHGGETLPAAWPAWPVPSPQEGPAAGHPGLQLQLDRVLEALRRVCTFDIKVHSVKSPYGRDLRGRVSLSRGLSDGSLGMELRVLRERPRRTPFSSHSPCQRHMLELAQPAPDVHWLGQGLSGLPLLTL